MMPAPVWIAALLFAADPGQWIRHEIVPRETIEQIAYRYGVTPRSLAIWNDIDDSGKLEPGKKLRVKPEKHPPPRKKIEYVVGPEDSWASIARRHGVDSKDLRAWNFRPKMRLRPGDTLQIWADPVVLQALAHEAKQEIRPGGIGIGPPNAGRLVNAVQVPEIPPFQLHRPSSAWGTSHAVRAMASAMRDFVARSKFRGPIRIVAMSRIRGGRLGGHLSHQTGRDVDIRLPLKPGSVPKYEPKPSRVDYLALWELCLSFAETREVSHIFLDRKLQKRLHKAAVAWGATPEQLDLIQWPRGSGSQGGLIRHVPGHKGHIHVRFRCGPAEPECVDLSDNQDGG